MQRKAYLHPLAARLRQTALALSVILALSHDGLAQQLQAGQSATGQAWTIEWATQNPAGVQFPTRAGLVELFAGRPDGMQFRLQGRVYRIPSFEFANFNYRSPVFQIGSDDVFAIVSLCAGSGCAAAGVMFVRVRANGAPAFSNIVALEEPFWSTAVDANPDRLFRQSGATIVLDYGRSVGGAPVDFVYANDRITTRRRTAGAPSSPPAAAAAQPK